MNFAWLIIEVYYVLVLRRALIACKRENRAIEPGWLWLELVPGLGFLWQFVNVCVVAYSLQSELGSRGLRRHRPGLALGVTAFTLQCIGIAFVVVSNGGAGHALPPHQPSLVWGLLFWTGWTLLLVYAVLWARYWRLIGNYAGALLGHDQIRGRNAGAEELPDGHQ